MTRELRATRYLTKDNERAARFMVEELPYLDYRETLAWYRITVPTLGTAGRALLGCNDRFFLLTGLCRRRDAMHPWLFMRCREVEAAPDGYLDLWARYHYKSSIGTFAGVIQEVLVDPEITVCILSYTKPIAEAFLTQIKNELEGNELLKDIYPDVLYLNPKVDSPRWSVAGGIVVKRRGNPKESTIEAWGLVDAQPVSRHYDLLDYDDVVTEKSVTATDADMVKKTTLAWERSDNLGKHGKTRKWHWGTRYAFGDTYGILLERGTLKARIYPATEDGTLNGDPVFMSDERWKEVKDAQRSTVNAQMLLNPIAGAAATFKAKYLKTYEVRPTILNVYILVDPSKGRAKRSDRTAIAVIGVDVAGNRYLLDGVRHRMKLSERWQTLKNLHQKWSREPGVQMVQVGYEVYGMQTDVETIIEEYMIRDGYEFGIEELNWPYEGQHSKGDRIGRLEPDMRKGRWYLPAVVWNPNVAISNKEFLSLWSPHEAEQKIEYRPYEGLTKLQRAAEATGQKYRIVEALRRVDEDGNVYDVTRAFIEEALFHPFAPHDDFIDAASRLYDLQPTAPIPFETEIGRSVIHPDA